MFHKSLAYLQLMRFHRPIGIFLLLWPTLWGIWIASKGRPDPLILLLFLVGVICLRAAGCVFNDLTDRRFDGFVARTKERPLVIGSVSVKEAWILCGAVLGVAANTLFFLNSFAVILAVGALGWMTIYPFCKRFIQWPQVVMGIAFSWGVLLAFATQTNHLPLVAWVLVLATIAWSVAYDTQYALVDRSDDLKIGIKSTAIWWGKHTPLLILICQGVMILLLLGVGFLVNLKMVFFLGLGAATGLMLYQHRLVRDFKAEGCFRAFKNNLWVGFFIFLGISLSYF